MGDCQALNQERGRKGTNTMKLTDREISIIRYALTTEKIHAENEIAQIKIISNYDNDSEELKSMFQEDIKDLEKK